MLIEENLKIVWDMVTTPLTISAECPYFLPRNYYLSLHTNFGNKYQQKLLCSYEN